MQVFVVREFFEDCNDTCYVGAFTDFWKAAKASVDCINEHNPKNKGWTVHEMEDDSVWLDDEGTYYSIDRFEVQ